MIQTEDKRQGAEGTQELPLTARINHHIQSGRRLPKPRWLQKTPGGRNASSRLMSRNTGQKLLPISIAFIAFRVKSLFSPPSSSPTKEEMKTTKGVFFLLAFIFAPLALLLSFLRQLTVVNGRKVERKEVGKRKFFQCLGKHRS